MVERGLGRLSVPRRPVPLYHTCHTGGLRPGRHDQGDGFVLVLKQSDRLAVGAGVAHADIGFLPTPLELLKAQLLDDELHPGLVPVLAVAERIEDLDHGLDRRDQIVHRDELAQDLADAGSGPESAADGHPEADSPVVTANGQQADVVNGGQGAVVAAAGEGDLELSGQALVERIAQQVQCDGFRVRRHVEHLALADSRQVAGGHVAHRVGAGFTGRDADFGEPAHDGAHVLEQGEMELDVLARGNVADSGGVGVGHLGDATQLIRRQPAEGDLDPHHLYARLTLAIDPVLQAERFEDVGRHLVRVQAPDLAFEGLDLFQNRRRDRHGLDLGVTRPWNIHKRPSMPGSSVTNESLSTGESLFSASRFTYDVLRISDVVHQGPLLFELLMVLHQFLQGDGVQDAELRLPNPFPHPGKERVRLARLPTAAPGHPPGRRGGERTVQRFHDLGQGDFCREPAEQVSPRGSA